MTFFAVLLSLLGWQEQPPKIQFTAGVSSYVLLVEEKGAWTFQSGNQWVKVSPNGELETSEPMTAQQVAAFMVQQFKKVIEQDHIYHQELIKEQDRIRGIANGVIEEYKSHLKQDQKRWAEYRKIIDQISSEIEKAKQPPKPADKRRI
jgi:hypothetical protein